MIKPRGMSIQEAFCHSAAANLDACWDWPYSCNGKGRATFGGRSAPRMVYEMLHGPINNDDLYVCHSCDNPICVNPEHLWLGTQLDNMRDCREKGRNAHEGQRPGEAHSLAKIVETDVLSIRLRAAKGEADASIAKDYPLDRRQISRIISGERWGHIKQGIIEKIKRPPRPKLTETDVLTIRMRVSMGETQTAVSKDYGVSLTTIHRIVTGETWAHAPCGTKQ